MMKDIDLKEITNARFASRLKQVLVLVAIILIGIMISIATQAQPPKHLRAKNACQELNRKRTKSENMKVFQVSVRKVKYKPMAEIDPPKSFRPSARVEKAVKVKKV